MKYIKSINEELKWPKEITREFIKKHPDFEEEHADWMRELDDKLENIKKAVEPKISFDITDIKGHDMNKGPYAMIEINSDEYKVWTTSDNDLWIEDFIVDNTSEDGFKAGFQGDENDIIDIIIKEYR